MSNYTCQQFTDWFYLAQDMYQFTLVLIVVICLSIIPIALLNVLILTAIIRTANLHTPSNILMCNLAAANLGVAFIAIPSGVAWKYLELYHHDNDVICYVTLSGYILCSIFNGGSYFSVIVATVDRYLALILHLRYPSLVTNGRVVKLCILIWIISSSQIILLLAGGNVYYITIGAVIALSLVVIVFCYYKIYTIIRHHHNQIASQETISSVSVFPNLTRYRKSVLNLLYVTCSQLGFLTPYFLCLLVLATHGVSLASLQLWTISACFLFLNSFFNPLVICMRHGELRAAIRQTASYYWSAVAP